MGKDLVRSRSVKVLSVLFSDDPTDSGGSVGSVCVCALCGACKMAESLHLPAFI